MLDQPLDVTQQRVLGALLEKQVTVPASYPLTLSSLRTACNQTSSRDPVTELDEPSLEQTARTLKERGLLRIVWSDTGRRTLKYHQTLDEALGLGADERALLTVLLLRGPQTPAELRTRTERLHGFGDRDEVAEVLARLAGREQPLVERLERRPREQDHRWVHLLGPAAAQAPPAGATAPGGTVDREAPLVDGPERRDDRVRATYAAVATAYADRFSDELADLPFERWLLERAVQAADGLPVVDAGCGPGHLAAHLVGLGADARGLDLTPEMVAEARERHPGVRYDVGDLRRLIRPESAVGWGAVLGWYSLIHLAGSELPDALAALARPLAPGGLLVLGLHAGQEVRHVDTWCDVDVSGHGGLDVVGHDPTDVVAAVEAAGLVDVEWYVRGAHTRLGESSSRLYVLGRRA
ncbi:Malonyl-[acyl-carrier protein] O-methyltransferase [Nocardioides dokdonensis FR1436]|uniref:Malonyl-[acyl-carrier protein] O-methyltransferase n=1 Tax=Nocardioides dokdonensis FR1436 TaxID=1300347 RepID=A0A1A9GQG3_9ACTN|nr:DUF480 domain-containing protein [Nocardioides dokdonensis]ANH39882.1 Malonyl-[acyl-carrier protein] O-methyltransferase [Nocardioides dokdonensis FR1436]